MPKKLVKTNSNDLKENNKKVNSLLAKSTGIPTLKEGTPKKPFSIEGFKLILNLTILGQLKLWH